MKKLLFSSTGRFFQRGEIATIVIVGLFFASLIGLVPVSYVINQGNQSQDLRSDAACIEGAESCVNGRKLRCSQGDLIPIGSCSPSPTKSPTPKPTPKPTVAPKITPSPVPTAKPTATPKPVITPAPTPKPSATPKVTPSPVPTAKPTATPKPVITPAPTPKPTIAPKITPSPTPTVKPTATPKVTPTPTPTAKPTQTPAPVKLSDGTCALPNLGAESCASRKAYQVQSSECFSRFKCGNQPAKTPTPTPTPSCTSPNFCTTFSSCEQRGTATSGRCNNGQVCCTPLATSNQSCQNNADCQPGLVCSTDSSNSRRCVNPSSCTEPTGTIINRNSNQYCCNGRIQTGACATAQNGTGSAGQLCTDNSRCQSGLACRNGVCVQEFPTCRTGSQLSTPVQNSIQCQTRLSSGQVLTFYECQEGTTYNNANRRCERPNAALEVQIANGARCPISASLFCFCGNQSIKGGELCSAPGPQANGARCLGNEQCASNLCTNNRCSLKTTGATCSRNAECRSNNCSNGRCLLPISTTTYRCEYYVNDFQGCSQANCQYILSAGQCVSRDANISLPTSTQCGGPGNASDCSSLGSTCSLPGDPDRKAGRCVRNAFDLQSNSSSTMCVCENVSAPIGLVPLAGGSTCSVSNPAAQKCVCTSTGNQISNGEYCPATIQGGQTCPGFAGSGGRQCLCSTSNSVINPDERCGLSVFGQEAPRTALSFGQTCSLTAENTQSQRCSCPNGEDLGIGQTCSLDFSSCPAGKPLFSSVNPTIPVNAQACSLADNQTAYYCSDGFTLDLGACITNAEYSRRLASRTSMNFLPVNLGTDPLNLDTPTPQVCAFGLSCQCFNPSTGATGPTVSGPRSGTASTCPPEFPSIRENNTQVGEGVTGSLDLFFQNALRDAENGCVGCVIGRVLGDLPFGGYTAVENSVNYFIQDSAENNNPLRNILNATGIATNVGLLAADLSDIGVPILRGISSASDDVVEGAATAIRVQIDNGDGTFREVVINPRAESKQRSDSFFVQVPCPEIKGISNDPYSNNSDTLDFDNKNIGKVLGCTEETLAAIQAGEETLLLAGQSDYWNLGDVVSNQLGITGENLLYYTDIIDRPYALRQFVGDDAFREIQNVIQREGGIGTSQAWQDVFPLYAGNNRPIIMDITRIDADPGLTRLGGDWRTVDLSDPSIFLSTSGDPDSIFYTTYESIWCYQNARCRTAFIQNGNVVNPDNLPTANSGGRKKLFGIFGR